jgi:hypothetical protein
MSLVPSDIGLIAKPSKWKLKQETLNTYNGDQWGENNPAWQGGVTSDMKAYQKKYREAHRKERKYVKKLTRAEQVEMFYQIQFHKYRND